jgi:hypothetical protein
MVINASKYFNGHPTELVLMEYAEGLENHRAKLNAQTAGHVLTCSECTGKVEAMRTTLSYSKDAGMLEPSKELTASILLASKHTHRNVHQSVNIFEKFKQFSMSAALVAMTLIMAYSVFTQLEPQSQAINPSSDPAVQMYASPIPIELLKKKEPGEESLYTAVMVREPAPQSQWEQSQRQAVVTYDNDIDEALAALEANPALARAQKMVQVNRERKMHTLKEVYLLRN